MAAAGVIHAISCLLDGVIQNNQLLVQIRDMMYSVLVYGITSDPEFSYQECIRCIIIFVHNCEGDIPQEMWHLYTYILQAVGGAGPEPEGGPAMEDIHQTIAAA